VILTQIQHELPSQALVHLIKLRARDLELIEGTLNNGSPLVGRMVGRAGLPENSSILLILRDNSPVVPTPQTMLQAGDEVVALCRTEAEGALRALLAG
jgi:trk system potassium uptake protein TrkA